MKIDNEMKDIIDSSNTIWEVIGLFLLVFVILMAWYGIFGLICWGVVNGILFLFGIPTTFTYIQGLILAFVIRGIRIILRQIVKIENKG